MTNDTVHVVVKDGYPVAVTPDHDVAVDALCAAGQDAQMWEDVDVIGDDAPEGVADAVDMGAEV